jgi:FemAB-related protein (PEP-CTERM system-associated)
MVTPPPTAVASHDVGEAPVVEPAAAADACRWDAYVRAHPDWCGYHLWAWHDVFTDGLGWPCHYLMARRGSTVTGVLPLVEIRSRLFGRALSSLPFVNYGGILADDGATIAALAARASALARDERLSYVLFRHRTRLLPTVPARSHKVAMLLPLPRHPDDMWRLADRRVRNHVRKAEKSGITVLSGGGELLEDFHRVFARNMRDLGTPVYGAALFAAILRAFPSDAHLHVAYLQGVPVASGFTYTYGSTMEVPSSSSLREYRSLCANYALYWAMLTSAIAQGRRIFDFGRSTPDDGTHRFKQQWGAEPRPLWWEYQLQDGDRVPNIDRQQPAMQLVAAAWRRLPVGVANRLGPRIARAVP